MFEQKINFDGMLLLFRGIAKCSTRADFKWTCVAYHNVF